MFYNIGPGDEQAIYWMTYPHLNNRKRKGTKTSSDLDATGTTKVKKYLERLVA